jgi:hypothetical protein
VSPLKNRHWLSKFVFRSGGAAAADLASGERPSFKAEATPALAASPQKVTAGGTIRHEQAFHYAVLKHIGPAKPVIPTLVGFAGRNERVGSLRR